jgi:hypothetical protein
MGSLLLERLHAEHFAPPATPVLSTPMPVELIYFPPNRVKQQARRALFQAQAALLRHVESEMQALVMPEAMDEVSRVLEDLDPDAIGESLSRLDAGIEAEDGEMEIEIVEDVFLK